MPIAYGELCSACCLILYPLVKVITKVLIAAKTLLYLSMQVEYMYLPISQSTLFESNLTLLC
jgi:hypothetical protein